MATVRTETPPERAAQTRKHPGARRASRLESLRRTVERFLEGIVLVLMVLLAVVVIGGVLFRKFGAPLVWYDEIASVMLAWLTYYGACLAALRRAHIGFPTFVDSLRPDLRRLLIVVRETVVIGFFALAAWTGWQVFLALEGFYLASLPWLSRQITQSVIPIGAVLFIIAELLSAGDELRHPAAATDTEERVP